MKATRRRLLSFLGSAPLAAKAVADNAAAGLSRIGIRAVEGRTR